MLNKLLAHIYNGRVKINGRASIETQLEVAKGSGLQAHFRIFDSTWGPVTSQFMAIDISWGFPRFPHVSPPISLDLGSLESRGRATKEHHKHRAAPGHAPVEA